MGVWLAIALVALGLAGLAGSEAWRRRDWDYGTEDSYFAADEGVTYSSAGAFVYRGATLAGTVVALVSVAMAASSSRR